jgi:hypothetical protein
MQRSTGPFGPTLSGFTAGIPMSSVAARQRLGNPNMRTSRASWRSDGELALGLVPMGPDASEPVVEVSP